MKVVVQRVLQASVEVNGLTKAITNGLLLYVGFTQEDEGQPEKLKKMAQKILALRIFDDEQGIMNKSVMDVKGAILSISQFTLYADCKSGNRPSYLKALNRVLAEPLYDEFNACLKASKLEVVTGVFGGDMKIASINAGPVTILLEM